MGRKANKPFNVDVIALAAPISDGVPPTPTISKTIRGVVWCTGSVLALMVMAGVRSSAEPRPLHSGTNNPPLPASITNSPLREIEPGIFQLGAVRLNKTKRTVSLPAVVNMTQGPVEYILVHEKGKVHESVLRTAAEPYHVHLASLLLQSKPPTINTNEGLAARDLSGQPAMLSITWTNANSPRTLAAEALVFNFSTAAAMIAGPWTVNGSRVIDGTFLAQRDGSIASVITDPDALINSLRPGRDRDDIWFVNTNTVPPINTPVTVTIHFIDSR